MIKPEFITEFLTKHKLFGGKTPYDKKEPWEFKGNETFTTAKGNQTGTWSVICNE